MGKIIVIAEWRREHEEKPPCPLKFWCPRWWSRMTCVCRR